MKYLKLCLALLTCTNIAWAAPSWTQGSIVKLELEKTRVVMKHQRIKSVGMEAMTMPFKVADSVSLAGFKVGDRVRFTVAEQNNHLVIDAMEAAK